MPRTPSDEDQPAKYSRATYSPPQRRRTVKPHSSPSRYHSDEHPEVPRVRRASLRLNEEQSPPLTPVSSRTGKSARLRKPNQGDYGQEEADEQNTTSKIMVAPRRQRSTVYEPPSGSHTRTRRTRKKQTSFYTQLQDLSHNRSLILAATLILLALIIVPVTINIFVSNLRGPMTVATTGDGTSGTPASIGVPPIDPHELVITPQDTDHPTPPMFATAAYLLDADSGATLYARNPFMHLPVMSTTKLMTAVLAGEKGNPNQAVPITDAIAHDLSQLSADSALFGIKKGETYTLRDLLYGMLLPSGNDAAIAVADTIGGNLPHFVAMMNERASQLGLHDTHYMNPHGLLATGQYSSAHDLAILSRYAFSIPLLHQISSVTQYHIPAAGNHPERFVLNGNQFLWWYPGTDSGKTGWDGGSNFVQVVSCVRNNHHLIGVLIHTVDWWTDMRDLMNWGFNNFTWISPHDVDFQHVVIYDNEWNYFASDKKDKTINTIDKGRYYIYTGYSIANPILGYFDKGGGLKKFGYPLGLPTSSNSSTLTQQFEHSSIQCDTASNQCKAV